MFKLKNEYKRVMEKHLESRFPQVKMKFRQNLCLTGKQICYDDLTKVVVEKNKTKTTITPLPFYEGTFSKKTVVLDYIGVYITGLLELLHICTYAEVEIREDIYSQFKNIAGYVFNDNVELYSLLAKNYNNEAILNSIDYCPDGLIDDYTNVITNCLRTDISTNGYQDTMRYTHLLYFIWFANKQIFFEMFFEILNYCQIHYSWLIDNYVIDENFEDEKTMVYLKSLPLWLEKAHLDFKGIKHFKAINMKIPQTDKKIKLTDCRGIAMNVTMLLHLHILKGWGNNVYSTQKEFVDYKNEKTLLNLQKVISGCFGTDSQAKILKGDKLFKELPTTIYCNGNSISYDSEHYEVNDFNMPLYSLEENFLWKRRLKVTTKIWANDITNHYFNRDTKDTALGIITTYADEMFDKSDIEKTLEKENKRLNDKIIQLKANNDRLKSKLFEVQGDIKQTVVVDTKDKDKEIEELKALLQSKTDIIDKLSNKIDKLNEDIKSYYTDEFIEVSDDVEDVSLEEKIKFLNEFKIVLIGGFNNQEHKLNELGWTNISQECNHNKIIDCNTQVDFLVINTKFVNHKTVYKYRSANDDKSDSFIYFNGTNCEALVNSCYDFIYKWLDK